MTFLFFSSILVAFIPVHVSWSVGHEHDWLKVHGLPGTSQRLVVVHITAVNLAYKYTKILKKDSQSTCTNLRGHKVINPGDVEARKCAKGCKCSVF
jgi:hypothetical protein